MRHRVVIFSITLGALLALVAFPQEVRAQNPSEQYLTTRRMYPPRSGVTLATIKEDPEHFRGATLELEGKLLGIVSDGEGSGALLLLQTPNDGTLSLHIEQMPTWVQPSVHLRVLLVATGSKNGAITIGTPDFEVVTLASASDIAAAEKEWKQRESARIARLRQGESLRRAARSALTSRYGRSGSYVTLASRGLSADAQGVYGAYRNYIYHHNPRLSERELDDITTSILSYSEQSDIDPRLVIAMIIAESDFNPRETSNKGAMGLGQLMPDEVKTLHLTNPYDPVQNIAGAIWLLKDRLNRYSGGASQQDLQMRHIILALASYNAGMGAVKKYGGVPPYRETRNYVKKIERIYRTLCGQKVGS